MICPICGSKLSDDKVDIGVGTQTGNLRCDNCGWYPEKDDKDIWSYEHEEVLG